MPDAQCPGDSDQPKGVTSGSLMIVHLWDFMGNYLNRTFPFSVRSLPVKCKPDAISVLILFPSWYRGSLYAVGENENTTQKKRHRVRWPHSLWGPWSHLYTWIFYFFDQWILFLLKLIWIGFSQFEPDRRVLTKTGGRLMGGHGERTAV